MLALRKVAPTKEGLILQDVPEPRCGPDEILVEVYCVGICGSDLHIWRDEKGAQGARDPGARVLRPRRGRGCRAAGASRPATASAAISRPWAAGSARTSTGPMPRCWPYPSSSRTSCRTMSPTRKGPWSSSSPA